MPKTYVRREYQTAPCDNCESPVKITRKSETGAHFCAAKACRAAKSKFYAKRRAHIAAETESEKWLNLLGALLNEDRYQCGLCGLFDALPGYKHPDVNGVACVSGPPRLYPAGQGFAITSVLWPVEKRQHRVPE